MPLVEEFNQIIMGPVLSDKLPLAGLELDLRISRIKAQAKNGKDFLKLNRTILEESYAPEILRVTDYVNKCGTSTVIEALQHWADLSFDAQSKLKPYVQHRENLAADEVKGSKAPGTNEAIEVSPYSTQLADPSHNLQFQYYTSNFKISYSTSGSNAVPTSDGNHNGTADYVELLGSALETSWNYEINTLGYIQPPDTAIHYYNVYTTVRLNVLRRAVTV